MFPTVIVMYRDDLETVIQPNGYAWHVAKFKWKDDSAQTLRGSR